MRVGVLMMFFLPMKIRFAVNRLTVYTYTSLPWHAAPLKLLKKIKRVLAQDQNHNSKLSSF